MQSVTIASSTITGYVQFGGMRECSPAYRLPPRKNACPSKFCRVVTCSEIDKSRIVIQHIYAIWRYFSQFRQRKIMVQHRTRVLLLTVFCSIILEIPHIFLLFGIYRDDWFPFRDEIFRCLIDMLKLAVAVWVWGSYLKLFLVSLSAVAKV